MMKVESHKLEDIAEINPALTLDKIQESGPTVSFVSMASISDETFSITNSVERSIDECRKGYTPFQKNDILIAKITPCFENGKIAIVDIPHELGFGSTEFHVIRANKKLADTRYLYHIFRTSYFRHLGQMRMTGSAGQKRVPAKFLSTFDIPLPPLAEQKRIAAILDKADELRSKRRSAIAELDSLTQAIFLEMFGDLLRNTKNWDESVTLGNVADIASGITKGRKTNGKAIHEVPYLAVINVQDKILKLSTVKTIEATVDEIERYKLKKDDLLLTEGGDPDKLGRGTLWNEELPICIHQNHIFRVRLTTDKIHPFFLNWLIGSNRGKQYFLQSAKQTTGIATINMAQLRNFPLLIPPIAEQRKFVEQLRSLKQAEGYQTSSLSHLDSLFSSLQQRAFSGEL
jgi:type I restriction enzyme S subunit